MEFFFAIQILHPFFLFCRHFFPFGNGIGFIEITCLIYKIFIFFQTHTCVLGIAICRELCTTPAEFSCANAVGVNFPVIFVGQSAFFQTFCGDRLHGFGIFTSPCANPDIRGCAGTKTDIGTCILFYCAIFQYSCIYIRNIHIIFHQSPLCHRCPCYRFDKRQSTIFCGNGNLISCFYIGRIVYQHFCQLFQSFISHALHLTLPRTDTFSWSAKLRYGFLV